MSISAILAAAALSVSCMTGIGYDEEYAPAPTLSYEITEQAAADLYSSGILEISVTSGADIRYIVDKQTRTDENSDLPTAEYIFNNGTSAASDQDGKVSIPINDAEVGDTLYFITVKEGKYSEDVCTFTLEHPTPIVVEGLKIRLSRPSILADGVSQTQIFAVYTNSATDEYRLLAESEVKFFTAGDNKPITFPGMKYSSTEVGEFSFWASYGSANTIKDPTAIRVLSLDTPAAPEDPEPDNSSFVRRALIMDYTGTGCGYCPYFIIALNDVFADEEYADKAVLAACHTYNGDPFAPAQSGIENKMNFSISTYPTLSIDMRWKLGNYQVAQNTYNIKKYISLSLDEAPQAGISVNMRYYPEMGSEMVATVGIKAAADSKFRVGAMILEDGLSHSQANYGAANPNGYDLTTHNHVLRYVDGKSSSKDYTGCDLGSLSKGDCVSHTFTINIDSKWVAANCRVVFFVTAANGNIYYVTNCIEMPLQTQTVPYQYQ